MSEINYKRLLAGGFLTGVLFVVGHAVFSTVFRGAVEQWMQAFNLMAPAGGAVLGIVLLLLALGMISVWLYAAIRPRYGAGPRTAVIAGVAVWALVVVFPSLNYTFFGAPVDGGFWLYLTYWLVVAPLAVAAGAWAYREVDEEVVAVQPAVAPLAEE